MKIGRPVHYPIFGPEISCPHCRQTIPALVLTDTYLCPRHGAFEVHPDREELVHLQSGRRWRRWNGVWYRQHTHPDSIRFEIHEQLDYLYTQGYRALKVVIAQRYQDLLLPFLERFPDYSTPKLFGLQVEFNDDDDERWQAINFELTKEPGIPIRYPYLHHL